MTPAPARARTPWIFPHPAMDQDTLTRLQTWFDSYAGSFSFPDEEDQRNILLKRKHTRHVRSNIVRIAKAERFDDAATNLAEAVALLHDTGRFPQYREWRTYLDRGSANHALLGVRVLREQAVLESVPLRERRIILGAVALHNAITVPPRCAKDVLVYLRMLRDADRIDIWRVSAELYRRPRDQWPSALGMGLSDTPGYSREVLSLLAGKRAIPGALLRTVTDYKLLQLAWLYDLSCPSSYRLAVEQGNVEEVAAGLPRDAAIEEVLAGLRAHVRSSMEDGLPARDVSDR